MFGWFRKKATTDQRTQVFLDRGAQFGSELISSFKRVMESRFGRLHDNYLNVLRGSFRGDIQRTDVPPLEAAGASYRNFIDEVSTLEPKMIAEVTLYMERWLEVADKAGVRSQVEQFLQIEVSTFCGNLSADGLKLLTDYAIPLKDANDAWRKANPELASKWRESK